MTQIKSPQWWKCVKHLVLNYDNIKKREDNLAVSMSIDAAWDDQFAGGVDGAGASGDAIQVLTHCLNHPETRNGLILLLKEQTSILVQTGADRGRVNHQRGKGSVAKNPRSVALERNET